MAAAKSRLPDQPKPVRPQAVVRRALAAAGVGTPGATGTIYLVVTRHVPFTGQAGVFEDLVAVIVLIALIAVAIIALAVSLDHVARSRLRYRAGKKAVDTAESNAQALKTYRMLHSSLSFRWLRWVLGLPDDLDGDDEDNGADEGEGNKDEDGEGKAG
jgi:hypothetical protein